MSAIIPIYTLRSTHYFLISILILTDNAPNRNPSNLHL